MGQGCWWLIELDEPEDLLNRRLVDDCLVRYTSGMRVAFSLCLCLLLGLAGCQREVKREVYSLTFARGADSQKLDPADVDDGESMKVLVNVTQGLVRFKHGTNPRG